MTAEELITEDRNWKITNECFVVFFPIDHILKNVLINSRSIPKFLGQVCLSLETVPRKITKITEKSMYIKPLGFSNFDYRYDIQVYKSEIFLYLTNKRIG